MVSWYYCHRCGAANTSEREVCFACGETLDQEIDQHADKKLLQERYRVLKQVGTGGFGAVYQAVDTREQGRVVAIKQINLRGLTPQEVIEATDGFNREVQLLSTLTHAHLPRIHDHFTDAEHWYLVMDFIEGETLEYYLRDVTVGYQLALRKLPLDEVLEIGLQLADVLAYLHSREPAIIFRDLKPANIMRTAQGKLYLIDFGIARSFKPGQLRDTIALGSPGYAAPEQYGRAQTTPRADIYSLGALLYHLLSRQDPADSPFNFAPLGLHGYAGLPELERLVLRMVELDVEQRPVGIGEVQEGLRRIVSLREEEQPRIWRAKPGLPPQEQQHAQPGQGGGQQQQQVRGQAGGKSSRRKFVVGGIAAGTALLVGGGLLAKVQNATPQTTAATNAIAATPTATPTTGPTPPGTPGSPSGNMLYAIDGLAWSPDNKGVAAFSYNGTVQTWDPRTAQYPVDLPLSGVNQVSGLSWSPNSQSLALATDQHVLMVDARSGQVTHTLGTLGSLAAAHTPAGQAFLSSQFPTSGGGGFATSVWSPDGRSIAGSQFGNLGNAVQVWDVQSHQPAFNLSTGGANQVSQVVWSSDSQYIAASCWDNVNGNGSSNPPYITGKMMVWHLAKRQVIFQRPWKASTGVPIVYSTLAFQPDTHNLAFLPSALAGNPSTMEIWDVVDNRPAKHYDLITSGLFAWSPDAAYLAYAGAEGPASSSSAGVSIFDVAGGRTISTYSSQKMHVAALAWSPDSKYIALSECNVDSSFHTLPDSNGVVTWKVE